MCGTPGRLEDLISTGKLDLSSCRFFVLDECVRTILLGITQSIFLMMNLLRKLYCNFTIFLVYTVASYEFRKS